MVLLFGVKYAKEIEVCGEPVKNIVDLAIPGTQYATEVSKGKRLSRYVTVKAGL